MSQHFLATLLMLASLAAVGLFGLAAGLAWRDYRAARQHALEHQRRLTALRAYHRHAERQIDQISRAAIGHMLTLTQRDARVRGRP
ncbi:hypothetical protein [Mycobacteroides abscessus]|uniref:hypothetical protein n=1 Tax=Mycobacteroides abscessus TaxID=36809 RepID=UPI000925A91F|nr:hypothetical protein [Mycobacteroides abscessus]SIM22648.1 Uncharacterised protein [Mycobacteroides abscessus subsp. abscessus]